MTTRHRLANRRAHETIAIVHDDQRYKVGLGREIGATKILEVFISAQRPNSAVDALASDGAILMSMLLQYGCPPVDIAHAMKRNPDGSPASPLGRAASFLIENTPQGE